jgi:hypothetical protein
LILDRGKRSSSMMRRASVLLSGLTLVVLATAVPPTARARSFDLIVADSIYVFCGPANSGITRGSDVGLVVNREPTDITATELSGATFEVISSDPDVSAMPFILNGGIVAPIRPNEAVGWASDFSSLLPLVSPQETYRSTAPAWFYGIGMGYPLGYEGTVTLDVTMTMGTDVARYTILLILLQDVETSFYAPHATRVSSVPLTTEVRASSWGAIKKLYR